MSDNYIIKNLMVFNKRSLEGCDEFVEQMFKTVSQYFGNGFIGCVTKINGAKVLGFGGMVGSGYEHYSSMVHV